MTNIIDVNLVFIFTEHSMTLRVVFGKIYCTHFNYHLGTYDPMHL